MSTSKLNIGTNHKRVVRILCHSSSTTWKLWKLTLRFSVEKKMFFGILTSYLHSHSNLMLQRTFNTDLNEMFYICGDNVGKLKWTCFGCDWPKALLWTEFPENDLKPQRHMAIAFELFKRMRCIDQNVIHEPFNCWNLDANHLLKSTNPLNSLKSVHLID